MVSFLGDFVLPAMNNTINNAAGYIEIPGYHSASNSRCAHGFYFKNLFIVEFSKFKRYMNSQNIYSMLNVLFSRGFFKIFYAIVALYSIFVINLKSFFDFSNECRYDQAVNFEYFSSPVLAKMGVLVSSHGRLFKYFVWISEWNGSPRIVKNSSNSSLIANLIKAFVSFYVTPLFVHKSSIPKRLGGVKFNPFN